MADDLVTNFKSVGFKVELKKLEDFQDDYGLKEPEGEDVKDDEDDDEDDEGESGSEGEDE